MTLLAIATTLVGVALLAVPIAAAQPGPAEPGPGGPLQLTPPSTRQPGATGPRLPPFLPPINPQQQAPRGGIVAPIEVGTSVRLAAHHHEGSAAIQRGVVWRVYSDQADGSVRFINESTDAQPQFRLPPGAYMVNASYGRASLTRRVMVGSIPIQDTFILNAGGLRLNASIGDRRLPEGRVTFSVFTGPGAGGTVVLENVRGGRILRLPVGEYYVVSRFGEANAIISGDLRVQPGRLTDATMHHRAAQITLKLVSEAGGQAIANTAWSVLTPGGDTVQESIGAFPTMILASGDYTVIARNEGRVFNASFRVETGQDREVEVLTR